MSAGAIGSVGSSGGGGHIAASLEIDVSQNDLTRNMEKSERSRRSREGRDVQLEDGVDEPGKAGHAHLRPHDGSEDGVDGPSRDDQVQLERERALEEAYLALMMDCPGCSQPLAQCVCHIFQFALFTASS